MLLLNQPFSLRYSDKKYTVKEAAMHHTEDHQQLEFPDDEEHLEHEDDLVDESYQEALLKAFLNRPVSERWSRIIKNDLSNHLTNDGRKLFIPAVSESAEADRNIFRRATKSIIFDEPKSCPAQIYIENVTEPQMLYYVKENSYLYDYYRNIGDSLRHYDSIAELTTNKIDTFFYNQRTKRIYGLNTESFTINTEGMTYNEFFTYGKNQYREFVQEFCNKFPHIIDSICTIEEQSSYITGKKIDNVNDLFTLENFGLFLENYIDAFCNLDSKYRVPTTEAKKIRFEHISSANRNAGLDRSKCHFGPVYEAGRFMVSPMLDTKTGKVLDIYAMLINTESSNVDYVAININSPTALGYLSETYTNYNEETFVSNYTTDDDGVITTESVAQLLMNGYPDDILLRPDVLPQLNAYFEKYCGYDYSEFLYKALREEAEKEKKDADKAEKEESLKDKAKDVGKDVKDKAEKVADKGKEAVEKGKEVGKDVKDAAEKKASFLNDKLQDLKKWAKKEFGQAEYDEVTTNSYLSKLRRLFNEILAPTAIAGIALGPVMALITYLVTSYRRLDNNELRTKIYRELETELKITEEKIKDCEPDQKEEKYKLMRIRDKLENDLIKIRTAKLRH